MNLLCLDLWRGRQPPTPAAVTSHWDELVEKARHEMHLSLSTLSTNQRAALVAFAREPTAQPTSQSFLFAAGLAASTMTQAVDVPLLKTYLAR